MPCCFLFFFSFFFRNENQAVSRDQHWSVYPVKSFFLPSGLSYSSTSSPRRPASFPPPSLPPAPHSHPPTAWTQVCLVLSVPGLVQLWSNSALVVLCFGPTLVWARSTVVQLCSGFNEAWPSRHWWRVLFLFHQQPVSINDNQIF